MAELKEIIIDRAKWYRGKGAADSALLVGGGINKMCCLGFVAKQCGLNDVALIDVEAPSNVPKQNYTEEFKRVFGIVNHTEAGVVVEPEKMRAVGRLMVINDWIIGSEQKRGWCMSYAPPTDEADRERIIAEEFVKLGLKVTFVN